MHAPPVHDLQLLDCQRQIDHLLEGTEDLPQAQAQEIFQALYRSMQDAWAAVWPVRLPSTDTVVHQAWESYRARGGHHGQHRPLIVAAAVKIATGAGLDSSHSTETALRGQVKAQPNWGPPRLLMAHGEFPLAANRFGDHCRHDGCWAWVPAGHGAMLDDASGRGIYCPRHADEFTARARPRERSGPTSYTDVRVRFLDARLREQERRLDVEDDPTQRQLIEAQKLVLDACADTDFRTIEGKALRYAVRCLLLPYASHPDFRAVWLPRRGEKPARPGVEGTAGGTGEGTAGRG
ncbi:hypothetical protein ACIRU8_06820 [Streptomyces sp. NPDC101175]|uniref:hypothetical protein n=1 Tax=Streptomyces sp. NPDC101175 TaxID=3366123 RepID=UPI0038389EF0